MYMYMYMYNMHYINSVTYAETCYNWVEETSHFIWKLCSVHKHAKKDTDSRNTRQAAGFSVYVSTTHHHFTATGVHSRRAARCAANKVLCTTDLCSWRELASSAAVTSLAPRSYRDRRCASSWSCASSSCDDLHTCTVCVWRHHRTRVINGNIHNFKRRNYVIDPARWGVLVSQTLTQRDTIGKELCLNDK